MKKLIIFLIAALLTGSISALPVSALRPIDQRVEVITQLGLAEGDENGDLQLEKNITR